MMARTSNLLLCILSTHAGLCSSTHRRDGPAKYAAVEHVGTLAGACGTFVDIMSVGMSRPCVAMAAT